MLSIKFLRVSLWHMSINLRHIMDFGKAKFSAKILNDDSTVHGMNEFLFATARYA